MPKPQSKTGIPDYFCAASFTAGPLGNLLLPKHQLFRQRFFWLIMRIVPPSFANLHKPSRAALIARGFFAVPWITDLGYSSGNDPLSPAFLRGL